MIYKVKPVTVSHESLLALRLHEQALADEYSRIVKSSYGKDGHRDVNEAIEIPLLEVRKKMIACQKVREKLERFFDNGVSIDDIVINIKIK